MNILRGQICAWALGAGLSLLGAGAAFGQTEPVVEAPEDMQSAAVVDAVHTFPEVMPTYPGGPAALDKFVAANLKYPQAALDARASGMVHLRLVVDATGKADSVRVLKSLGNGLDEEATRIARAMPAWKPGLIADQPVATYQTMAVRFVLPAGLPPVAVKPAAPAVPIRVVVAAAPAAPTPVEAPAPIGSDAEQPRRYAEKMPEFPGGNDAMFKHIGEHVTYTKEARKKHIEGTVFINFTVTATGELKDITVTRGLGYGLDEQALNAVKTMPNWIPARQNGKSVPLLYTLPIKFKLS